MGEIETEMGLPVAENESLSRVEKIDGYRTSDRSEKPSKGMGMVWHWLSMGLEGKSVVIYVWHYLEWMVDLDV